MTPAELFSIGLYHGYIPQILIAEAIYTAKLKRKPHFWGRLAVALPIYGVLAICLPNLIAKFSPGWFSITIFTLSLLLCGVLFDNRPADILFCCVCAQLTQNLSYNVENLLYLPFSEKISNLGWFFISVGSMTVIYGICAVFYFTRVKGSVSTEKMAGWYVFPIAVVTMLFVYVMQYLFQVYGIDKLWISRPPLIVCCVFGLGLQFGLLAYRNEQAEKEKLEYFLAQSNKQYELSRTNMELLNMKAHDLKHYIRRVKEISGSADELGELEDIVRQYEKTVKCGNKTLDALLTDKQYQCRANVIDLSLIVQGEELNFVKSADLVSLFANLLDNAIEAQMGESEAKRYIALKVFRKGSMICIHEENYCTHAPELEDGIPRTTKPDRALHGYGVKSIRYVAEKYAGTVQIGMRENVFVVNILLPLPAQTGEATVHNA